MAAEILTCLDPNNELQDIIDGLGDCVFDESPPSDFEVFVKYFGHVSTTLGWTESVDPNGGLISYSVFIDGSMIASNLTELDYYIQNLQANSNYSATVRATNNQGAFVEASLDFSTVPSNIFDGQVILRTQQEVDDFVAQQYTEITNWLIIGREEVTSDIVDLEGLQTLVSVTGSINIGYNFELETLLGLNNITSVINSIALVDNPVLSDITGLSGIPQLDSYINIVNNDSLESLDAFSGMGNGLTDVNVEITDNDSMVDIDGLSQLDLFAVYIRENDILENLDLLTPEDTNNLALLYIFNNAILEDFSNLSVITLVKGNLTIGFSNVTNLDFLSNLNQTFGDVRIFGNDNLTDLCGLQTIVNADNIGGEYFVQDNLFNPTFQDISDGNCSQ